MDAVGPDLFNIFELLLLGLVFAVDMAESAIVILVNMCVRVVEFRCVSVFPVRFRSRNYFNSFQTNRI